MLAPLPSAFLPGLHPGTPVPQKCIRAHHQWYEESFRWLVRYELTPEGIKSFVIGMREAGLKPISYNSRIRVANAYFRWAGLPLHLAKLKAEQEVLPTFDPEALRRLIQYRPNRCSEKRVSTLICLLIDCGVRINEALELRWAEIEFEDLLLVVRGKMTANSFAKCFAPPAEK